MQKHICFSCVHIQKLLNGFLSRVYNTSLKIKRSEMDSRPSKTLANTYKYPFKIKKWKLKKKKKKGKY